MLKSSLLSHLDDPMEPDQIPIVADLVNLATLIIGYEFFFFNFKCIWMYFLYSELDIYLHMHIYMNAHIFMENIKY
jgi:hypothetical protein